MNLLGGGYTSTVRHASRPVEIVFPARRQKSTLQSIEPHAIDGKAWQCEFFFPSYAEESAARVLSALSTAMRILSALSSLSRRPCAAFVLGCWGDSTLCGPDELMGIDTGTRTVSTPDSFHSRLTNVGEFSH